MPTRSSEGRPQSMAVGVFAMFCCVLVCFYMWPGAAPSSLGRSVSNPTRTVQPKKLRPSVSHNPNVLLSEPARALLDRMKNAPLDTCSCPRPYVPDTKAFIASKKFVFEEDAIAQIVAYAGPNKLLAMTYGNKAFLPMLLNMGDNLKTVGAAGDFVCISLDTYTHDAMTRHGFRSVFVDIGQPTGDDFHTQPVKFEFLLALLDEGISVHILEPDAVFFRHPFDCLKGDAHMEMSSDHIFPHKLLVPGVNTIYDQMNIGIFFVRATDVTRFVIAVYIDFQMRIVEPRWDQLNFNRLILDGFSQVDVFSGDYIINRSSGLNGDLAASVRGRCLKMPCSDAESAPVNVESVGSIQRPSNFTAFGLRVRIIDGGVAMNGMNYVWRRYHRLPGNAEPMVVHFNGPVPKVCKVFAVVLL